MTDKKKTPGKRGRKSAWDEKIQPRLLEIAGWCKQGLLDKNICEMLGISQETFYLYKRQKPELSDALAINKEIADITVENSLFKRATGFPYVETTTDIKMDKDGNELSRQEKTVNKQALPDTTAISLWLRNRMPDKWRDKQTFENIVKVDLEDTRTPEEVMIERGIPIPVCNVPDTHEMRAMQDIRPMEAPERQALPEPLPVKLDIESLLRSQERPEPIKEPEPKNSIKFISTDDEVVSPFGIQ